MAEWNGIRVDFSDDRALPTVLGIVGGAFLVGAVSGALVTRRESGSMKQARSKVFEILDALLPADVS